MPSGQWKYLKSGSDIRGTALGNADSIALTNEVVERIALAFAMWISQNSGTRYEAMTIAVGNDPRLSSKRIKTCLINALTSIGVKIYDCSLACTPAMLMAVSSLTCTASVQITASHHPREKNGFKFFTKAGALSASDIEKIIDIAQNGNFPPIMRNVGKVKPINMMNYYCDKIKKVIMESAEGIRKEKPLENLKIAVDAGNGAGGFFAKNILEELGADTSGSIFLEPDGNFPNHLPNPEDPFAIKALSKAVLESKSDIGIIFDTDVDRVGFVDSKGHIINKNKLIAFVSAIILNKSPGATIVTDSVTSDKLSEYIKELGGSHFRYKRGYRNVIEYAEKLNKNGINCPLAIESSGHAALRENEFVDDGAYLAAKIIAKLVEMKAKGISMEKVAQGFINAKEQLEIRITIHDSKIISSGRNVLTYFKGHINEIKSSQLEHSFEGIRIKFKARWQEGWCILRQSVHDPVLVLNIESYVNNGAISILNALIPFFEKFQFIDINEINEQVNRLKDSNSISVEV